ncbi:nucleotidyl transferase AbiEii/AbiGii toxin family protein [Chryseobacterium sp. SL1]|uniref:nucleotidyl transferase AbiEii/AbiGii toxin family protein n=1 Tax=Chryseobacterium sp. SL1 TaxID=2995159 RepID=UPI0022741D34|nr:nucleotidyl transferase AbiEii/AbiGii toxin family protein [Chryseobacterium sp. SL1]MCY1660558.1 nucleotidyl transferase AbiEii/AbiGii toxin family protein [Chryseobacterium sp. SL1]MCY1663838.1 nucleotidyl transferase AbiEii/AbiGii toxin family protein [Chryseobacterium sp. SL1]
MLHKETVSTEMWELLQRLMNDEKLKDFNLVGGTALSLQIGHRLSIDIDLFTTKGFDEQALLKHLADKYPAVVIRDMFENTILLDINKIKVDILAHRYLWQKPIETKEGVRLASLEDIGAMKLHAIFQNGTRIKDFIDIHFLLEHHPLKTYLQTYQSKYGGNPAMASYALLHHDNIDKEAKVKMLGEKESDMKKISERLKKAVHNPMFKFEEIQNLPKKGRGFRR